MTADQAIGYALINTTAISAIVGAGSAAAVYSGLRPANSGTPSINYFKLTGSRANGYESEQWSINCRATTQHAALALAKAVKDLWGGSEGMTTYGSWNGFDIARASVIDQGVVPETDEGVYNAVVDIRIVYRTDTVS